MLFLGIETSCDETAAAVVSDDRAILSNVVLTQLEEHKPFGGVVPEIAARSHLQNLPKIIKSALSDAQLAFATSMAWQQQRALVSLVALWSD